MRRRWKSPAWESAYLRLGLEAGHIEDRRGVSVRDADPEQPRPEGNLDRLDRVRVWPSSSRSVYQQLLLGMNDPGSPLSVFRSDWRMLQFIFSKLADDARAVDIHHACSSGCLERVTHVIRFAPSLIKTTYGAHSETALHIAADHGHPDISRVLIDASVDVNASTDYGETALHWACECFHSDIVEQLIRAGAFVHIQNESGSTPLHLVLQRFARIRVEFGVDDFIAMHAECQEICKHFIAAGVNLYIEDSGGSTQAALMAQCEMGELIPTCASDPPSPVDEQELPKVHSCTIA